MVRVEPVASKSAWLVFTRLTVPDGGGSGFTVTGAVLPVETVLKLEPLAEVLLLNVPVVPGVVAVKDSDTFEPAVIVLVRFQVRVWPAIDGLAVVVPVVEPVT